jgi:hypothetical protein
VWGDSYVWGDAMMAVNTWVDNDAYVAPSSGAKTMHVIDLDGDGIMVNPKKGDWQATVTVVVRDIQGGPAKDTDVSVSWGETGAWCRTDNVGQCTLTSEMLTKRDSSITFTIQDAMHPDKAYDASANVDSDGDSDGTTIVVQKP